MNKLDNKYNQGAYKTRVETSKLKTTSKIEDNLKKWRWPEKWRWPKKWRWPELRRPQKWRKNEDDLKNKDDLKNEEDHKKRWVDGGFSSQTMVPFKQTKKIPFKSWNYSGSDRVGPIVIIRLSQPAIRPGAWT